MYQSLVELPQVNAGIPGPVLTLCTLHLVQAHPLPELQPHGYSGFTFTSSGMDEVLSIRTVDFAIAMNLAIRKPRAFSPSF